MDDCATKIWRFEGVGGWGGMGCIRFRSSVKQTGSGVSNLDGLVELPLKQGLGG